MSGLRARGAWVVLALCAACGGSSGQPQPGDGDAGPGGGVDAALSERGPDAGIVVRGECGAPSYTWLTGNELGELVASEPHGDPLTVFEAKTLKFLLGTQELPLDREPEYETNLHRIRYQTQDRGKLVEATGMVIVPEVDDPTELPVLLWLHGTTGASDGCAPSSQLEDSDSDNFKAALLLSLFSSWGYIIVAPDYIGMKSWGEPSTELHPYLIGEPTAIASLDAVRAAFHLLDDIDAEVQPGDIAVWGASQGGAAAAFTVKYASEYAPELDIAAGVFSVPPLDLAAHWRKGLSSPAPIASTGFFVMAFAAMAPWYGHASLSDVFLPPYDADIPAILSTQCRSDTLDSIATLDQLFTPEILAAAPTLGIAEEPSWSCIAANNSINEPSAWTSSVPSLIVVGEFDDVVDPAIEQANFERVCESDVNWSFLMCRNADHGRGFSYAIDDSLDFIDARLAGIPVANACTVTAPRECQNEP